jgi:hypothetical protein
VTQPQEAPKVARATPFLPGISGGIWSPPGWPTTLTPPEKEKEKKKEKEIEDVSCGAYETKLTVRQKDAEIRLLHDRIERLMCEKEMALSDNARLAGQINRLSVIVSCASARETDIQSPLPPVAPIPVRPFSGFPYPYSVPPLTPVDNVYQPTGLPPHVPLDTPARTGSTVEVRAEITFSPTDMPEQCQLPSLPHDCGPHPEWQA